ncbi:NifB/NifX family molybdenum-iron cluster-binding protein [Desulfosoma caldarium]|uniref:Putative Fe-Mo cluster-binding NifX family protein n=1 Tax=Desulfosoma caldarium TaxID=610254 RepID=A0A3N1VU09_9BACT|nr:NifB/NifX family molybdenum-iron cluster-binding protein [Desulfosoma caldarium]ROR03257.1 putative Fe-Mo cluster-binding NifX family protein [Desulfosoma caldarium]
MPETTSPFEQGFIKVAIPRFGPNVAPHFATAPEILLCVFHKGRVRLRIPLDMAKQTVQQKLEKVLALGVQVFICGAIEERARVFLERRGIRVLSNRSGPVAEVVRRFASKEEKQRPSSPSPTL